MVMNEEQLYAFGARMGAELLPGTVVALTGGLGAGKTVLAKAIAAGLGVTEPVTSPTFTILCEYRSGRLPFYHFDVYRLGGVGAGRHAAGGSGAGTELDAGGCVSEMDELGYEDYFFGDGVTVVEWADLIEELLPADTVRIRLEYTSDPGARSVEAIYGI
ncbi:MAG: tRNA (adenosine(37)-N6)-threonylcarbamoyltransferase complex ATPase subunit type 1 TsaE [Clostridiales Family XIII bacterium]|jgi:tRNA threonylcarbamoyladenosine biosynthesis protein TsaE|nr:tRNA (adenosine(37)-N6)-threonylcarbamoyltransferase complex ATPase subunit type 1 TsaE [Clostridiales Family XIII bacterium]